MSDASHRDRSTAAPATAAQSPDTSRRRFLLLGAGAASAAAAAPVLAAPAAIVEAPQAQPSSQGYRETEHVRNYYASTRL
jgi:hypothetical protein